MRKRTDVIFVYDGTFDGFLCCVYKYYYSNFNPVKIVSEDEAESSFFQFVTVVTDAGKAEKVKKAICSKISPHTFNFMRECMLCYEKEKEYHMLWYIIKGFKVGAGIYNMISDEDVSLLRKYHRHLEREKHLYLGILRFYKSEEVYISVIKPKNKIIPLIANHFVQRFSNQSFMIYDYSNKQAFLYDNKHGEIVEADNIQLPEIDENEENMQKLWKLFYDTIAIKERNNPKCRMNFMPKRTWDMLPEMKNL